MIEIPQLTPELLREVGRSLGGCTFDDPNQIRFLSAIDSCDVQAAPGNGKTTLLTAKLAVLSKMWTSRAQGVCVISHTNTARNEIERALLGNAATAAFLGYPHFIGTVTGFFHQFLALPYLRGFGWTVERIDDDAFSVAAKRAISGKPTLRARTLQRGGQLKRQTEQWVERLELAPNFVCVAGQSPTRLAVRAQNRQPGPATDTGRELEEIKAALVARGIYRFGDMVSLATKAVNLFPHLGDRIRARFPLVLLDEAQDSSGSQLDILELLFRNPAVVYQRLGDRNQMLYEGFAGGGTLWAPPANVIPLNRSRRFGQDISDFASRLTTRHPQRIEGEPGLASRRTLLLFDEQSISSVLPAYADEIRAHWPSPPGPPARLWAVASRHSRYSQRGAWTPKSLIDYHPTYRAESSSSAQAETMCRLMQKASMMHTEGGDPRSCLALIESALVRYLRLVGHTAQNDQRIHNANLWHIPLFRDGVGRSLAVRRLVRDSILFGDSAWNADDWVVFCASLKTCLGVGDPAAENTQAFASFMECAAAEAIAPAAQASGTKHARFGGVTIHLGSIHSVKGRTTDAMLVVESEIWKGPGANERCMDLETVVPHAFGVETRDFSGNEAQLTAATNVFVGVTRARSLLALAMRKSATSDQLRAAAAAQGWIVRDLTVPP